MSFREGENVGPYRILNKLGQGGMATVFKAYHPALDRSVAIKVLHPAFMEDPNFLARFQREARVVANLDHPNIVPIYDYAEHAGQPYLVMKFIEGDTLKARLLETGIPPLESIPISEAVGNALSYAHERGILHRDIKPSNILLTPEKSIYLADFGLARIAEAGQSTLSSDRMLGTPQYISPEQAQGVMDLDEGTDIYSLGIVLYEMVVGKVPFNADTPFSIIHDHIYTPLPLPTEINPFVDDNVERVLLKALAKDRTDRFKNVMDLVEAYRSALLDHQENLEAIPVADWGAMQQPGEESTQAPVVSPVGATPSIEEQNQDEKARSGDLDTTERKTSKRRNWIWVAVGLVLTTLCFFAFLVVFSQNVESAESPIGYNEIGFALAAFIRFRTVDHLHPRDLGR